MRAYILAMLLMVSPAMALEDGVITLSADQKRKCNAEGGCSLITQKGIEALVMLGYMHGAQDGKASCKGVI